MGEALLEARYQRSAELHERAVGPLPGGVNSNFRLGGDPVPLFWSSGKGAHLEDVDGNRYIDYVMGMGPSILGHAPDAVVDAVAAALARGQTLAGQSLDELELAELVVSAVPCADQVRFGSSGSEMVQLALRVARAATGRPLVVKFEGHYHGWFDSVMVSTSPPVERAGPADRPRPYLQSAGQSEVAASELRVLPWNDAEALAGLLAAEGAAVAAVIMEPILCNSSVCLPRPGYLEMVRELCNRHGVVLIFDEIITGFRVGPNCAQGLLGVSPDLCTLGKAIGGGFPIAALAGRRELMELTSAGNVVHGGTYNANLVSVAAAHATLRLLTADGGSRYRGLSATGEALIDGMRRLSGDHMPSLHVQGLGAVFNTTFSDGGSIVDYRSYQRSNISLQRRFLRRLQDRGVRVTQRGTWFLSTEHTAADVEETLAAVGGVLAGLD